MEDSWLEPLDLETCLEHLRAAEVGRLAAISDDGAPIVLPVNFQLVETLGLTWVALRTRPGNVIDRAGEKVAFEIDNVDPGRHRGWSVMVRGTLLRVDPDSAGFRERFDSAPWLDAERDSWLVIEPFSITGRELHPSQPGWPFHIDAYL